MVLLKKSIAWLLILVPVFTFFWFFFRYTVNIPVNDDYPAILLFLNNYLSTPSLYEKLKLIFSQHNEHRIVYCRLWSLLYLKVDRPLDFNVLSFIGNLSIAGIGLIFLRRFLPLKKSLFLFIPVSVLLFNLTSSENMLYTMCALSNFPVYVFILLCLLFVTSSTPSGNTKLLLGAMFFLFSVLTSGAGIMLFPVTLGILIYKKQYRHLLIYGGITSLIMFLYFHGYIKPANSGSLIPSLMYYKVRCIIFFFGFLGDAFNYYLIHSNGLRDSLNMASIIGVCFFLLFIHITRQQYYRKNLFNYSIMVLIMLNAGIAAISRTSLDLDMAAHSRYRINGIIFCIALYFWLLETYKVEKIRALSAILVVAGWYFLVINLGQSEYLPFRKQNNYLEIMCARTGDSSIVYPDPGEVTRQRAYLKRSAELDVYHLPSEQEVEAYIPHSIKQTGRVPLPASGLDMVQSVLAVNKIGGDYLIRGYAFLQWRSTDHQKVFVGLQNETDSLPVYFTSKQMQRFDLDPYFRESHLENGGYWARIYANDIKPGVNTVWIRLEAGDSTKTIKTDTKFTK